MVFHSSDVDEAREQVARIFCPHRLEPVRGGIDARHHSVRLNNTVSLNYVTYQGDVRIVPGELGTFTVVQAPQSGQAAIRNGARELLSEPGLASVPRPDEPLAMRWTPDCAQLIVQLDQQALEDDLAAILDQPLNGPIRWQLGLDTNRGSGGCWWRQVQFLVTEIDRHPELLDHPLAIAQHERWLRTGLLLAQPHNYSRLLEADPRSPGIRQVRHAVDLIEAHPDRPWTAPGLAKAVSMSVSALRAGFRRYVGMPPMAYLEDVRLAWAHRDLLAADPADGVTVTDVAWRWCFTHLGRFEEQYRRKHGELPSATLHRSASPAAVSGSASPR